MADRRKTVLAGGFIPASLASLFSLRSLYEELSKSKIIGDLLTEYLTSGPSVEDMCDKIAERILTSWLYLENFKDRSWDEYLDSERENLEKNVISKEHIAMIIGKAKRKKREKEKMQRHHGTDE